METLYYTLALAASFALCIWLSKTLGKMTERAEVATANREAAERAARTYEELQKLDPAAIRDRFNEL